MTGTCYNFEMEDFFSSFLRRAGMPASAGLSCFGEDAEDVGPDVKTTSVSETVQDIHTHTANVAYFE